MPGNTVSPNNPPGAKYFPALIAVLIGWYVLLCLAHYFNQRPLWNDEQCVFDSVRSFSPQDFFTKPLLRLQVFPRAYLSLIQKLSQTFAFHLLSLRFLPFVAMITAFFIWARVASRQSRDRFEHFIFILSWTASVPLIYYSAELKQYSMDVLAGAVFLSFLYGQKTWLTAKTVSSRQWITLMLLPLWGLFSYTAFLFMIFPFINLVLMVRQNRSYRLPCLAYSFMVLAVVLFSYLFDIRLRPFTAVTEGFGDYFISFQSAGEFFKTFGEGTMNLFSRWFAEQPRLIRKIAIFFITFGLIRLFSAFFGNIKKEKGYFFSIHTVALVLFLELFILGALKKYPFTVPRTALFYCPVVLFLTAQGINDIRRLNKHACRIVNGLYVIFLVSVNIAITRLIFSGDLGAIPRLW
ncbi:MAG: hypothetical protein HZA29_00625 [Candidatus Omnitrophica bacterium]|nr:hypothetical protein [Candidatus Omnitrophota bacterium]